MGCRRGDEFRRFNAKHIIRASLPVIVSRSNRGGYLYCDSSDKLALFWATKASLCLGSRTGFSENVVHCGQFFFFFFFEGGTLLNVCPHLLCVDEGIA